MKKTKFFIKKWALFKVSTKKLTNNSNFEKILRENEVRILSLTADYFVLEKTGHSNEIKKILDLLEPYGMIEFSRSGRVAIIKWSRHFYDHLKELSVKEESTYK